MLTANHVSPAYSPFIQQKNPSRSMDPAEKAKVQSELYQRGLSPDENALYEVRSATPSKQSAGLQRENALLRALEKLNSEFTYVVLLHYRKKRHADKKMEAITSHFSKKSGDVYESRTTLDNPFDGQIIGLGPVDGHQTVEQYFRLSDKEIVHIRQTLHVPAERRWFH